MPTKLHVSEAAHVGEVACISKATCISKVVCISEVACISEAACIGKAMPFRTVKYTLYETNSKNSNSITSHSVDKLEPTYRKAIKLLGQGHCPTPRAGANHLLYPRTSSPNT